MTIRVKIVAVILVAGCMAGGLALSQAAAQGVSPSATVPAAAPAEGTPSGKASEGGRPDAGGAPAQPQSQGAPPVPAAPDQEAAKAAGLCEVPEYLRTTESSLGKVAEVIKAHQKLEILVVGSRSSMLSGPDGAGMSYPAQLESALRDKLPGVTVSVATDLQVKRTAAEVAEGLEKLAKDRKPTLVIWQTGTVDAVRSVDPDDFRAAIDDGVTGLLNAGTDVLLMNLQYSPRMETMITVAPYLDNMRVGAQEHNVPLFDRFALMRYWNENGLFDLFNPHHGFGLAKRVHECLGQALAAFVIEAAHATPADKVQR